VGAAVAVTVTVDCCDTRWILTAAGGEVVEGMTSLELRRKPVEFAEPQPPGSVLGEGWWGGSTLCRVIEAAPLRVGDGGECTEGR